MSNANGDDARQDLEDAGESPPPVAVPHAELSEEALLGVIESFVLREGTDYGERDVSHESKVGQVRRQLERGEAQILFDPATSTIDIVLRRSKIHREEDRE
jgi:uncharacterized protein